MIKIYLKFIFVFIILGFILVFLCFTNVEQSNEVEVSKKASVSRIASETVESVQKVNETNPSTKSLITNVPENAATSESVNIITCSTTSQLKVNIQNNELAKKNHKKKIPILYYHCVSDNVFGIDELFVSPKDFSKQMEYLKSNNFHVITFDELKSSMNVDKPIIITFDDGYENNYLEAYPILKKYNFKATIFMCTDFINGGQMLKENEIKEMCDLINFQSHTLSHSDLRGLTQYKLEKELSDSKNILESLTGQHVSVIAYPTGYCNEKVIKISSKYYKYGTVNYGGAYSEDNSDFEIPRIYIPGNLSLESFKAKIIEEVSK